MFLLVKDDDTTRNLKRELTIFFGKSLQKICQIFLNVLIVSGIMQQEERSFQKSKQNKPQKSAQAQPQPQTGKPEKLFLFVLINFTQTYQISIR